MEELQNISGKTDELLPDTLIGSKELINALPIAIYTCDIEGKIFSYNEAAVKLWGREPEIGKDLWCGSWKIYSPTGIHIPLDECPMATVLKEKRSISSGEIIIEKPDGVRINVQAHPRPLYNERGIMTGAINMLIDITEKKITETTIRETAEKYRNLSENLEKKVEERTLSIKASEERYHKMVEVVEDYAIILLDKDGYIQNWNKGAEKIKGYTEEEIVGKSFRIFYVNEDREAKLPEKIINQARTEGKAMHEGWRLRKDNTTFWGYIVITALHDENNEVLGFTKVTRDLTERKLAEDQMQRDARDIEYRNKQLEEFAYIASHDLQEPLRKIRTFSGLLERNFDNKPALLKYLERINSSAIRMSKLIKDVLEYSQLSQGTNLHNNNDLNIILDNVKEDLDLLIEDRNVIIKNSHLPVVSGVPIQLHQLFYNLINNSIKFCEDNKTPVIEINAKKLSTSVIKNHTDLINTRKYYLITFKDNGVGFEQQYDNQVFKMFHRLNKSNSGTGIGLALCKKIVENHNGHIAVESELGNGSVFSVFLPVNQ